MSLEVPLTEAQPPDLSRTRNQGSTRKSRIKISDDLERNIQVAFVFAGSKCLHMMLCMETISSADTRWSTLRVEPDPASARRCRPFAIMPGPITGLNFDQPVDSLDRIDATFVWPRCYLRSKTGLPQPTKGELRTWRRIPAISSTFARPTTEQVGVWRSMRNTIYLEDLWLV